MRNREEILAGQLDLLARRLAERSGLEKLPAAFAADRTAPDGEVAREPVIVS